MKTANNVLRLMAIVALTSSAVQAMETTNPTSPISETASEVKPFNNGNVADWFKAKKANKEAFSSILTSVNNECTQLDGDNLTIINDILTQAKILILMQGSNVNKYVAITKFTDILTTLEKKISSDSYVKWNGANVKIASIKERFTRDLNIALSDAEFATAQQAADKKQIAQKKIAHIMVKAAAKQKAEELAAQEALAKIAAQEALAKIAAQEALAKIAAEEKNAQQVSSNSITKLLKNGYNTILSHYQPQLAEQAKEEKEAHKWSTARNLASQAAYALAVAMLVDVSLNNGNFTAYSLGKLIETIIPTSTLLEIAQDSVNYDANSTLEAAQAAVKTVVSSMQPTFAPAVKTVVSSMQPTFAPAVKTVVSSMQPTFAPAVETVATPLAPTFTNIMNVYLESSVLAWFLTK